MVEDKGEDFEEGHYDEMTHIIEVSAEGYRAWPQSLVLRLEFSGLEAHTMHCCELL